MDAGDVAAWVGAQVPAGITSGLSNLVDRQIDRFMTTCGLEMNDIGLVYVALAHALLALDAEVVAPGSPAAWTYTAHLNAVGGQAAADINIGLTAASINQADNRAAEVKQFMRRFLDAVGKSRMWIMTLTACYQVKPLSPASTVSFFRQFGPTDLSGQIILPIVKFSSARMANLVSVAGLRNAMGNSKWVKYHTGFAATAGIIVLMCDSLGAVRPQVGHATYTAVTDSATNYWDPAANAAIPQRLIAVAAIWAKVNRIELGDWYQGAAALAAMNSSQRSIWTRFFTKQKELAEDNQGITNATNADELVDALGADIIFQ